MVKRFCSLFLLSITLVLLTSFAFAAEYPAQPIKVVVPYAAGGTSDIQTRIMSKYIKEYLGQDFVIVNISGAGGGIGNREVLNAAPDGYTVLFQHQSMFSNYLTGVSDFTYNDFAPVCLAIRTNRIFVTRPDAPWNNLKDVVEDAKKRPGQIRLGAEIGATSHFQVMPLQIMTNNAFVLTASKGGDMDRITKIMGSHMDLSVVALSSVVSYLKSGELKALAVTSAERDPFLPDVPTAKELGIDAVFMQDTGFYMPPKTPENIVAVFSKAIGEMSKNEAYVKEIEEKTFSQVRYMDTEEFVKFLEEDFKYWSRLAKEAGFEPAKK
ncbi:tripartite tricarboxylate transporter substrate binding protein [Acetomicrobium sp. S15 = DSM 107314]|jgi:tripartite-type tricarboxylate transporter receptor subunit TctC|uniref:tripartite tricarboxylate transporter substrate binding protein n=1 Tax=Acetomicrobium sp. S15 = DSM 107314 TaxID=2529858 RepID=UPI0018E17338|nr:tripartite tricarboxylate transporter substrate binding protein [Acetomicrobium sp. S15 = DSM 107314]